MKPLLRLLKRRRLRRCVEMYKPAPCASLPPELGTPDGTVAEVMRFRNEFIGLTGCTSPTA
jgi:hypothetical protein